MKFVNIKSSPNNVVLESHSMAALCVSPKNFQPEKYSAWVSDVSQVVEAFILYDSVRVVRFPRYLNADGGSLYMKASQATALESLLAATQSEGLLEYVLLDAEPKENYIRMAPLTAQRCDFGISGDTDVSLPDAGELHEYSTIQQEVARRLQSAFAPSSESSLTEHYTKTNTEQRINIAKQLISALDSATRADINSLKQIGVPISLYIPPFLAIVLERVLKGADFGQAVVEVRQQFSAVRKLIADYEMVLKDTTSPLKKLIQARSKIFTDIERISSSLGRGTRVGFLEWADVLDAIPDVVETATSGALPQISLVRKLIDLPVSKLRDLLLKRRYAALFHAYRDFHEISNYTNLVSTSFEQFEQQWINKSGDNCAIYKF